MTENLWEFLALMAGLVAVFCAIGWTVEWRQRLRDIKSSDRRGYARGWDNGYDRAVGDRAAYDHDQRQQTVEATVLSDEEYQTYAQTHVISQELAALAAEDVAGPDLLTDTQRTPGHPDEAGDDTLTQLYLRDGTWEQDQRSIGATGQSLWFLGWQQRQAVA